MQLADLQSLITAHMEAGKSLDDVEDEIINCAPVDDDAKSALWLLAWSYMPRRQQRETALMHLEAVGRA